MAEIARSAAPSPKGSAEIVPTTTFDQEPIYLAGETPDPAEVAQRIAEHWGPYHAALAAEIDRLRSEFGFAVVFDAHSIRSCVPRFFEGLLPDLNFGTASGASADEELAARAYDVLDRAEGFSSVRDGRFTGGYITRAYGDPENGVHAVQLEQSQSSYMNEDSPYDYREKLAERVRPTLRTLLETMLDWANNQTGN